MYSYLHSFFIFDGVSWYKMLLVVGLAFAFGAVWLMTQWIPLLKRPPLWAVMLFSALLTMLAVAFVQIPLQYYANQALTHFFSNDTLAKWLLLAGVPMVLISGLVQEGAKMIPMLAWWWQSEGTISPKLGLAIGAAVGAGFGIFEAIWGMGGAFASGWTTGVMSQYGWFLGISPFWERFFAVGSHIAISALIGYGLAKGKGWQFYLIGSVLHALLNYIIVIYQYFTMVRGSNIITPVRVEIFVAVFTVIVTAVVMIPRWRKNDGELIMEPAQPVEPALPEPPGPPPNPPGTGI
jgi:RsiW-degrading membrane proteinase PrsW (M82 family)